MGTKFIRNTDDATIICKIATEAQKAAGLDTTFVFRNKKYDRSNNTLLSNGYTEISDEDLALLEKESSTYKYYVSIGRLTIVEDLPIEAMTPDQMLIALQSENARLKQELIEKGGSKNDSAEHVEKQQLEIEQLKQEIVALEEKQLEVEQLKQQLVELEEKHLKDVEEMQNTIDELTAQLAEETVVEQDK